MSPEQENFDDVRRLLALKRHEQPPPGYFQGFSHQVVARIQAGENAAAESTLQRLMSRLPWIRGIWNGFEVKPLVAGVFGIAVCSLLVVGLVSSERSDASPSAFAVESTSPQTIFATTSKQSVGSIFERAVSDRTFTSEVYTAQSRSSIFDEIQRPRVQPVSFSPPSPAN
jgi:hypothetical protein